MVCQAPLGIRPRGGAPEALAGPYPTLLGCQSARPEPAKGASVPEKEDLDLEESENGARKEEEEEEEYYKEKDEEAMDAEEGRDAEEGHLGAPETRHLGAPRAGASCGLREVRRSGEAAGRGPPHERGEAEREQEDFWLAASRALEDAKRMEQVQAFLKKHGFAGVGVARNGWLFSFTYPLHRAVEQNDPGMVSALLKSNAEAHVRNSEGKTPRQLAKSLSFMGSHEEVLKVLKRDRTPAPGVLRRRRLAAAAAAAKAVGQQAVEEEAAAEPARRLPTLPEGAEFREAPCTKVTAEVSVQCNLYAEEGAPMGC